MTGVVGVRTDEGQETLEGEETMDEQTDTFEVVQMVLADLRICEYQRPDIFAVLT